MQKVERTRQFVERWRPLLAQSTSGELPELPAVPPEMEVELLRLWFRARGAVEGEAAAALERVADRLDLCQRASALYSSGDETVRFVAIGVLNYMDYESYPEEFSEYLENNNPILSLIAARLLAKSAPDQYLEWIVEKIAHRDDWPDSRVAGLVEEVGVNRIYPRMIEVIDTVPPKAQARLVKIFTRFKPRRSFKLLERFLEDAKHPEVLAACLASAVGLGHPGLADYARKYVDHETGFVRIQAVTALGRLGRRADKEYLVRALGDHKWWVRYRAARALVALGFETDELEKIEENHVDKYAREILHQVIAEETGRQRWI